MNVATAYLHVLDGRLRIKVPALKGSPDEAARLESRLRLIDGVDCVTANPVTGSVLVLYDAGSGPDAIVDALRDWGYLGDAVPADVGRSGSGFGSLMLRATTEFALQQLLTALI